jgi:hypothetical protein
LLRRHNLASTPAPARISSGFPPFDPCFGR